MRKKVEFVFSIVNYNSENELNEFILNIKKIFKKENKSYFIVVVNNYSTKSSLKRVQKIANEHDELLLIENTNSGYGDGNNIAIEYINNNFIYNYIVVSNCDIEINQFSFEKLDLIKGEIIAPKISNLRNRQQNPMQYCKHYYPIYLFYLAAVYNSKILFIISSIYYKILRIFDKLKYHEYIYMAHGSFIIIRKSVIDKIFPIFDSEMFLLCEEAVLAEKARSNNIKISYTDSIKIKHFEDVSMSYLSKNDTMNIWRKSHLIFYKKYYLNEK